MKGFSLRKGNGVMPWPKFGISAAFELAEKGNDPCCPANSFVKTSYSPLAWINYNLHLGGVITLFENIL
jgi:hypothetical protein